jgi:hypothetical protein
VWALSNEELVEHTFSNGEGNAIGWVFDMMESLPHERFTRRGAKRSMRIFSKVRYQRMGSYREELKILFKPYLALFKRTQGQHRTWIPPSSDLAKFNIDVAVTRTGDKGVSGALCRDHYGLYLGASAVVFEGLNNASIKVSRV